MPVDWTTVYRDMKSKADEVMKHVKFYNYSSSEKCLHTDNKLVEFMQDELRKSKSMLFEITDLAFGREISLTRDFQNLRDSLDIFLDEIKLRHCEWKDMDDRVVRIMVGLDSQIVRAIAGLNRKLAEVTGQLRDMKRIRVRDHMVISDSGFLREIEDDYADIAAMIDGLVVMFKKRETACNIKELTLKKTMEYIEKEIKRKI